MEKEWITEHPLLCHCHHQHQHHNHKYWYHLLSPLCPLSGDYHNHHHDNHQNFEVLQENGLLVIFC